MKNSDIFVFVAVLIFVAFSFYNKYIKKNNQKVNSPAKQRPLFKRDKIDEVKDDYEPYSKKGDGENH